MNDTLERNVLLGSTACWTASVRALESRRPDRLFEDPWAESLAGPIGAAWLAQRTPESVIPIVLRTRYFDDALQQVTAHAPLRQIVLVAAGLDTRAYRLPWPAGTRLFEIDQADVLARKHQILDQAQARPHCERQPIGLDLTADWPAALIAAGFQPDRPSGWLMEGLLFYLPDELIVHLLDSVTTLTAPGSWLGCDVINRSVLTSPFTRPWIEMQAQAGAPWIGTLDDPKTFFAARGWTATLTQAGQPEVNHGRWHLPVIPVEMPNMPHNWLVTAQKISAA